MENRIKELRKSQKLSQDDLAKLTHSTRQTINAIENNKYDPSLDLAFKLAKNLNVEVNDLFSYGTDQEKEAYDVWCKKYHCELYVNKNVE